MSASLAENSDVIFSVADTGIGIAPEDQQRIFQDFAQVDNPIQRRVKGTGLGLPLSKKLATLLGGEVRVAEPTGNRVDVHGSDPVAIRTAQRSSACTSESAIVTVAADTSEPAGAGAGRQSRNDDDVPELSEELRVPSDSRLHHPGSAGSPGEDSPKVIILDVVLRSEDSWRLLADLKQDARTRDIPVMIASTIEDQAKAFHLGADDYLLKPVERAALLERFKALTAPARNADPHHRRRRARSLFAEAAFSRIRSCDPGGFRAALEGIREASQRKAERDYPGSDACPA